MHKTSPNLLLEVALYQLAEFKGMLEGITLHLEKTAPSLVLTVAETYQHRIARVTRGDLRLSPCTTKRAYCFSCRRTVMSARFAQ